MTKREQSLPKARAVRRPAKPAVDLKQENAALKQELAQERERQAATSEALTATSNALTATSDVLKVISRSTFDLAPVLETVTATAARLCEAEMGFISRRDGDAYRFVTAVGTTPETTATAIHFQNTYLGTRRVGVGRETITGRVLMEGRAMQITDLASDPEYKLAEAHTIAKIRTLLGVPLLREGEPIGVLNLARQRVEPFTDRQIELVRTFADQAVIAIENTRLLTEQREALEQQTATAEVLQVINSSPGDLAPVFEAMLKNATRLCEALLGHVAIFDGELFHHVAVQGDRDLVAFFRQTPAIRASTDSISLGRVLAGERLVHIADCRDTNEYRGKPVARGIVDRGGIRTLLTVALRKDDRLLGTIHVYRHEVRPFSDKQVALLENFAAQAVIAMENARLITETREALEQQTATSDILRVMSTSPTDSQPVFDTIVRNARELCGARFGVMHRFDGEFLHLVACDVTPDVLEVLQRAYPMRPSHSQASGRAILTRTVAEIPDVRDDADYDHAMAVAGEWRSLLAVPMLRADGTPMGTIVVQRSEPGPFAPQHVEMLKTFADQAVIAIENVRLFTELRESLEQQTATGDVLKIISRSSVDLETVLDTLVETVARLCRADTAAVYRRHDYKYHHVASCGLSEEQKAFFDTHPFAAGRGTVSGRVGLEHRAIHVADVLEDPEYTFREGQKVGGYRTMLGIPLLRGDELIGIFVINRTRVEPFTDKEIELATTFADQAVIAIENARLFEELRERQAELARSVDELTATGDVLKIISRSSVDLETVLDTLVETVTRLCRADQAGMFRRRDDRYHLVASRGFSREAREFILAHPMALDRGTMAGRVALERGVAHIPDVLRDPEYTYQEGQKIIGHRTLLGVPLLRENELIGIFAISRTRVDPFTQKEIELATSFADQALIAIENARLFEELRDRQAELRVTFDNMGDGVAMFGADAHLVAWNRNLQEMLDLPDAVLAKRPSYAELFRYLADRGEFASADLEAELRRSLEDTRRKMRFERTRPDGRVIEVRRNPVPGGGFVLIYADITERKRAEEAIRAARDAAESALRELQTAQASLVHAQKMAALGQLTAGIAHEIKNPLNFVNNFAGLSVELLDELKQATAQAIGAAAADKRAEIVETIGMLTGNLEKIAEHGRRADGIVKSMLQHSRGGSGDWQATDLNALVEEALNLAYHGARAQDQSFNITIERDFDQNIPPIEVVPQDVMRVFLNLIGNGFYAANKRRHEGDCTFRPALKVTTRDLSEAIEIGVRDNGIGISLEHREKLFQPFFTTKPTGEGTGLGLSISFEIVTQQHGGTITVESEVGQFTEFTVRLPRRQRPAAGRVA